MDAIGRFRIIRQLGGGAFGEVYLAEDPAIGRKVAVKVLRPHDQNVLALVTSRDEEALQVLRQRFLTEAQILASLEDEPYVVNVLEFGEDSDGAPFYVMPYLPHSLADELGEDVLDVDGFDSSLHGRRPRALPMARALELIEQLLVGLAAAHERGLIHRDIKPSNLMFSRTGDIRIVDFGVAKMPDSPHTTVSQLGIGSRNYIAPEQLQSTRHVDARADVYAVGVVAYRMLTGRLPIGRFPDPVELVPALSRPLNDLVLAMMAINRDQRPHDAGATLKAFKSALSGVGSAAGEQPTRVFGSGDSKAAMTGPGRASNRPDKASPTRARFGATPRWLAWAVPLVLVMLIGCLVLWLGGDEPEQSLARSPAIELQRERPVAQTLRDHLQFEDENVDVMFETISQVPMPLDPAAGRAQAPEGGFGAADQSYPSAALPADEPLTSSAHAPAIEDLASTATADPGPPPAEGAETSEVSEHQRRVRAVQEQLPAEAWPELDEAAPPLPRREAGEQFTDCAGCPEMIVIPAGRFTMGSPPGERQRHSREGPRREVQVPAFALGSRSVTFTQFDACVDAGACSASPHDRRWGRGRRPVINVSWHDAQEYVVWLSATTGKRYRLPSEAEWEYAARAGTETRFNTGDCITDAQANFNAMRQPRGCPRGAISNRTSFAGAFDANAWGLYDMHGNVADWTADCWNENYEGAPIDGSAWLEGDCSQAIHRGGGWFLSGDVLRSASRTPVERDYRMFYLGFRVARDLDD